MREPTLQAKDHLLVVGLFNHLPPVGTEWPDENREEWFTAVRAAFLLLYPLPQSAAFPVPSSSTRETP